MGKDAKKRKITPLNAWAFSFACAIGWAAFIMPATTFLPQGGVTGSILAFIAGGAVMCVIAACYHYLGNLYPDQGGIYSIIKCSLNRSIAFVAAWGMGLAHMCCIPLNAKAMAMLIRVFLEEAFELKFEINFFQSDTLLLEAVLIVICLFLFGLINVRGIKQAARVQTIGAIVLLSGIVIMLIAAAFTSPKGAAAFTPSLPEGSSFVSSFIPIFLITPWAFVGFDSLSKVTQELNFPVKRIGRIMIIAVICGTFTYIANILTTLLGMPADYASWTEYLNGVKKLSGVDAYPVALAAKNAMGKVGVMIFFASCISATLTGLVGFFTSISRLLSQMAEDDILPDFLGKIDPKRGTPAKAIWTVVVLALLLSLMRDSFDFIEEVASVGTALGFGLVAAATLVNAQSREDKKYVWVGLAGFLLCLCFLTFLLTGFAGQNGVMSFKSYFLLMLWVFIGIAIYSFFTRNKQKSEIELDHQK
ncbi:MAG: APC family permease [Clostridia bacterium]|nr:APC family permease [Clostridia bacterium]